MSELEWETLDTERTARTPGFDVRRDDVRLPDGTETEFDYVETPPTVVILAFRPDGKLVVIEEYRHAVGRVSRGLPAGTVESGDDSPAVAARRELREETGYEAGELGHLCTTEPINGLSNACNHHFVATDCTSETAPDHEATESIRVETTTLEALREQISTGAVRDARTIVSVLRWGQHSRPE